MSLDRYLQPGKVNAVRKTPFTPSITLPFTLAIKQVSEGEELAHDRMPNLDADKTPCWAGATPLLHTVPWPK